MIQTPPAPERLGTASPRKTYLFGRLFPHSTRGNPFPHPVTGARRGSARETLTAARRYAPLAGPSPPPATASPPPQIHPCRRSSISAGAAAPNPSGFGCRHSTSSSGPLLLTLPPPILLLPLLPLQPQICAWQPFDHLLLCPLLLLLCIHTLYNFWLYAYTNAGMQFHSLTSK